MENWKPVTWYECLYEISNLWKIKSINFHREWKEKVLKPLKHHKWHSKVILYKDSNKKGFIISRLVAQHFIPNPLNLPMACPKVETLDENGLLYNWEDNIYWGTAKDNMQDMISKWRDKNILKWKCWKDHIFARAVIQYSIYWEFIKKWESMMEIERELWIFNSNISKCCKWKRKMTGGFIWKYNA